MVADRFRKADSDRETANADLRGDLLFCVGSSATSDGVAIRESVVSKDPVFHTLHEVSTLNQKK
jgi:hypothetical protein